MIIFKDGDVVRYIGTPDEYLVVGRLYVVGLEYGQIFVWDGVGYDYGVDERPEEFELVLRENV